MLLIYLHLQPLQNTLISIVEKEHHFLHDLMLTEIVVMGVEVSPHQVLLHGVPLESSSSSSSYVYEPDYMRLTVTLISSNHSLSNPLHLQLEGIWQYEVDMNKKNTWVSLCKMSEWCEWLSLSECYNKRSFWVVDRNSFLKVWYNLQEWIRYNDMSINHNKAVRSNYVCIRSTRHCRIVKSNIGKT